MSLHDIAQKKGRKCEEVTQDVEKLLFRLIKNILDYYFT